MTLSRVVCISGVLVVLSALSFQATIGATVSPVSADFEAAKKKVNYYRMIHSAPSLKFDDQLLKGAQEWADKLAAQGTLQHAPMSVRGGAGESLAMMLGAAYTTQNAVSQAVEMWYSSGASYNYDNPEFSSNTKDFTNMVWKSSKSLGFGMAAATNGALYVVVRYYPGGNVLGTFQENVLRGSSG